MICGFNHLKMVREGIADVISHFIVWDTFLIKHRIPYFISGRSVPNVPIDVEEMNKGAIKYARSGILRRAYQPV